MTTTDILFIILIIGAIFYGIALIGAFALYANLTTKMLEDKEKDEDDR